MPKLGKTQTKGGSAKSVKKKNKKGAEVPTEPKEKIIQNDEDTPITPFSEDASGAFDQEDEEENVERMELVMPTPFEDGLVSVAFCNPNVIPKRGGVDVDLLRGFLGYYSTYETYIGGIVSKVSFMKRQGGRLL